MGNVFNPYMKRFDLCEYTRGVDGKAHVDTTVHLFPGFIAFEAALTAIDQTLDLKSGMALAVVWVMDGSVTVDDVELTAGNIYICSTYKAESIKTDGARCCGVILPACRTKLAYLVNKTVMACISDSTDIADSIRYDVKSLLSRSEKMALDERSIHGKMFDYYIVNVVNDVLHKSFSDYSKTTSGQRFFSYIDRFIYSSGFRLEAMPDCLYMSRAKMYRLTKNFGGVAELINSIRLTHAFVDILYNNPGVTSVDCMADKYGFKSSASFRRAFKKKHGITPGKLQKNIKMAYEKKVSYLDFLLDDSWMESFFVVGNAK